MKRILNFLFAAVAMTGIMVSCGDDGGDNGGDPILPGDLVLEVDKAEITADGVSTATFTVMYNDGEATTDVTADAVIMDSNGNEVENGVFTAQLDTELGEYTFTATYDDETSNEVSVVVKVAALSLTVDKTEIWDDGIDMATLTVLLGERDITSESVLRMGGNPIEGNVNTITSTSQGTRYTFTAVYNNKLTNQVAVMVIDSPLILSAEKETLLADGEESTTLTVKEGNIDVTSQATIKKNQIVYNSTEVPATTTPEAINFSAQYNGKTSNTLIVEFVDFPPLVLTADKLYVNAGETVTFKVMRGEDDVTSQCALRKVGETNDITGNTYSGSTVGLHQFVAHTKNFPSDHANYRESNETNLHILSSTVGEATFNSSKTPLKYITFFMYTGTWCNWCYNYKMFMVDLGVEKNKRINYVYLYEGDHSTSDPMSNLDNELFKKTLAQLDARFHLTGYPMPIWDLDSGRGVSQSSQYDIYIAKPARTGIKVESSITGDQINFTVTVGAKEADKYYVGALLTEDNVVCSQVDDGRLSGGQKITKILNYNHCDVFRDMATNSIYGDELGSMAVGDTKSKTYSFTIKPECRTEQLSLLVYTLYEKSLGQRVVANSVKAPANRTTGFIYE